MSGTTTKEEKLTDEERQANARKIAYVNELLTRARAGDEAVVPQLRQLLDDVPRLWTEMQDMSECALFTWANVICGKDLIQREAVIRDFRLRVRLLMSDQPCSMERMLASQVGFFRMQLLHAETVLGQMAADGFSKASETVDKRITAGQKRLSKATKDLLAFQKAHGLTPLSKPVAKPVATAPGKAGSGLDPAQRAARDILAQAETPHQRAPQTTADQPTDVPLRPPVAGTERVVTSESMLADNEVPNDSIFSGLVGAALKDSSQDREAERERTKKTDSNHTDGRERVVV